MNEPVRGTLHVELHLWATSPARAVEVVSSTVEVGAQTAAVIGRVAMAAQLGVAAGRYAREDAFLVLRLEADHDPAVVLAATEVWLTAFRRARLPPARPLVTSIDQVSPTRAVLRLLSNATAALVAVECDSVVGAFSDGGLTLLAGQGRELSFEARAPFELATLRRGLRVRSVWDTYEGN